MTIIIISLLLLVSLPPILTLIVVNDNEASPHSRPYMVSLQLDGEHMCGGFLVSDQFVLTAAHCRKRSNGENCLVNYHPSLNSYEKLTVVVGAHDLKNSKEGSQRIGVKSYIKHPGFQKKPLKNDLMLLELETKVKRSKTAYLPLNKNNEDIKAGTICIVAGWGRKFTNGPNSDSLMEAKVEVMENKLCLQKWKKSGDLKAKYSVLKMMCVSGDGGSCEGDSGGPLVCGGIAIGVTSFGNPYLCNSHVLPNVYTKISAYYNWIKEITS